jgi:hypothetical protein
MADRNWYWYRRAVFLNDGSEHAFFVWLRSEEALPALKIDISHVPVVPLAPVP